MNLSVIGTVTLNISTLLYFVWLVPQLFVTQQRHSAHELSLSMHAVLLLGYMADLVYGIGVNLPTQYKLVSAAGLVALLIEHYQIWKYGLTQKNQINFYLLTFFFCGMIMFIGYHFTHSAHTPYFYSYIGTFTFVCWIVFIWPQIIKNQRTKSTIGFSIYSIFISIIAGICDVTSAFTLNWPLVSQIGAVIILLPKFIFLGQFYYYEKHARVSHAYT